MAPRARGGVIVVLRGRERQPLLLAPRAQHVPALADLDVQAGAARFPYPGGGYSVHPSLNVGVRSFVASALLAKRMFAASHFSSWPGKSWAIAPTSATSVSGPP